MEGTIDQPGIIPNSFKHIFDKVAIAQNKRILVRASYLEIYNEEIRDLLSKDPKARLELKEVRGPSKNPETHVRPSECGRWGLCEEPDHPGRQGHC